jgi:hypothetical protein
MPDGYRIYRYLAGHIIDFMSQTAGGTAILILAITR